MKKMKLKLLLITLFICSLGWSQNRGKISGVILDKDLNNEPLGFANITLKGTSIGTSTNVEGKYTIEVAAGTYILVISFLGYETVEIPCIVKENEITVVNKTIGSGSVSLSDVVVKSTVNREKETALLLEQKNAIEILLFGRASNDPYAQRVSDEPKTKLVSKEGPAIKTPLYKGMPKAEYDKLSPDEKSKGFEKPADYDKTADQAAAEPAAEIEPEEDVYKLKGDITRWKNQNERWIRNIKKKFGLKVRNPSDLLRKK
jgi:hypothetical protein